MGSFNSDFTGCVAAGLPILYVDTFEDDRLEEIIKNICKKLNRNVITWSLYGARDIKSGSVLAKAGTSLSDMLKMLLRDQKLIENKSIILRDAHFFLDKPEVISYLRLIAQGIIAGNYDCNVCLLSPLTPLPKELESYVTVMEPDYLDEAEIRQLIIEFADHQEIDRPVKDLLDKLVTRLKGLSRTEIDNILALAISEDGMLTYSDLPRILEQKQQTVKKSGILEMIRVKESMEDIGGLENLKTWLLNKAEVFKNIRQALDFGVDIPKGVLIAGMPGCGKSLTAKAAARAFDVPLLRLDMGRLMGKYVGESESNMRRAIKLTEASSPCVLWIDELEKAFAGMGGGGSEVTTRLFGSFLTWMQEKNSLAFVVATANKIDKLPPELLRKGRFDEIFYVGLPNKRERRKIIEIHIQKRRRNDLGKINFDNLIDRTEGYCGADLEGIVRDGIENAFINKRSSLTTQDILKAIENTHSLSEVMKDSIDGMISTYKKLHLKSASTL